MNLQRNYITGAEYAGANQDILMASHGKNEFGSDLWMTFLQAKGAGRSVIKGVHGTPIKKVVEFEDDRKGVKFYTVFNLEQTEEVKELVSA